MDQKEGHLKTLIPIVLGFLLSGVLLVEASARDLKTGFLVLAPDRGVVGNRETRALFKRFKKDYPAGFALLAADGRMRKEYSGYLENAVAALREQGVSELVVIPLFLSEANPRLRAAQADLPLHYPAEKTRWAPTLARSYLAAQILLDRVNTVSDDPARERLVVVGRGAVDKQSEKVMREELEALARYLKPRKAFQEIHAAVYYDWNAEDKARERHNREVDELIVHAAAKRGRTLLAPFFIGEKYSARMSQIHWLGRKFEDIDLTYIPRAILHHPNVLLWMKKTANRYTRIEEDRVGVVVMAHGAQQPYNDAVEKAVAPLRKRYRVEMAYGMGDPDAIQGAVSALERDGIEKIVFVRMYPLADQFKARTDYILGLSDKPPQGFGGRVPSQLRCGAVFSAFGGYEESPLVADILLERIREISRNPAEETVLLLAHGSYGEKADRARRKVMERNIDRIRKRVDIPFRAIRALTVREDWDDKRKKALEEIRRIVEDGNRNGRVLIIPDRLYGSGLYQRFLGGLQYEMNGKGLAPHPNLTRWLEEGVRKALQTGFPFQADG